MMPEVGYCPGIENYSRPLSGRPPGSTPDTLYNFFPDDYLLFVDESHATVPQVRGNVQRRLQPQDRRSSSTASACPARWTTGR